jgi:hypothetical protein
MFKLTGIITGIALTASTIYALAPDTAIDLKEEMQQSGMVAAEEMLSRVQPNIESLLAPAPTEVVSTDHSAQQVEPTETETANTGLDSLQSALQQVLDNTEADLAATPIVNEGHQTVFFWKAFDNKAQAEAFVHYLQKKTGFAYEVVIENDGVRQRYQAALTVPADQSSTTLLQTIETITGPAVKRSAG